MVRRARLAALKRAERRSSRRSVKKTRDQCLHKEEQINRIARMEEERRIEKAAFVKLQQELVEVRSRYDVDVKALKIEKGILERERDAGEEQMKEFTTAVGSAEDSISNYAHLLKISRRNYSSQNNQPTFVQKVQEELFRTIHKVEILSSQQITTRRTYEETITSLKEDMANALKEKATTEAELRAKAETLRTENEILKKRQRYNEDEIGMLKFTTAGLVATRDAMNEELGALQIKKSVENDLAAKLKKAEETISLLRQVNEANANVIAKLYCEMGVESSAGKRADVSNVSAGTCMRSVAA